MKRIIVIGLGRNENYYGHDCGKRISAIREYKRISGSHKKDELYLSDLLK